MIEKNFDIPFIADLALREKQIQQNNRPIIAVHKYKGTVSDLVDEAKDFVLSKIDLWVGTRAESTQVPTKYEIPQEVFAEAIVNAVVHRDYTSNAGVQGWSFVPYILRYITSY